MAGAEVEFVVVGAGMLGLSAARALGVRDHAVTVCDAAAPGHAGSGSRGAVRIFRLGYDDPGYVRLAQVALRQWRQLEAETATALVTTTGQVTFGDDLEVLARALAGAGAPAQTMTAADVAARFPAVAVTGPALFEPTSGVIAADGYLAAMAGTPGVTVRPGCRVTSLIEEGRRVRVVLDGPDGTGDMVAEAAVVCAGPWTAALVAGLDTGLRPLATLEQVAYLQPVAGASAEVPVVVERRRPWFYGLPDPAQGRYKVSLHGAGPALVLDDAPGWRPHGDEPDEALVAELVACSGRVLPGFDPHPVATERCLYDNTPDGDFVLDRVGRIAFGCGTSGHGFKFAPLLGEILADLAVGALHHPVGSLVDRGRFASARLRSLGPATGPAVHP